MTSYVYPAIIEGDAANGYSVYYTDLPGCTSGGDTQTEAALNAYEVLGFHLEAMLRYGDPFPAPSSIEAAESFSPETEIGRILVVAHVGADEKAPV